MRALRAYWGYLAATILIVAWSQTWAPLLLGVLSLVVVGYVMFQAPGWCHAVNRDGTYCRNNAYGILLGCSRRQHRWQKAKMIVARSKAGNLTQAICPSPKEKFNALIAVVGVLSAIAALFVPS